MIGSLMYLTASRPDIKFAVCAYARFQVTPKTSHLLAVKRIFRYLKSKPTLGLWYSRDSPFKLVAYTDSDYAGATLDRKSTTGDLLTKGFDAGISKEVGTLRYLSLVVPLTKVGDETVHKELGDRMERAATTASSLEAEQDSDSGPRCQETILGDVNAQTRFEITSKQSIDPHLLRGYTLGSGEDSMKLIRIDEILLKLVLLVFVSAVKHMLMLPVQVSAVEALVDKKRVIVMKSSIRRDHHLNDAEGTDCLPTTTIFEELAHMGAKSIAWNEFNSSMASLIICLATNQKFNLSKYIFDAMVKHLDGGVKFLLYLRFLQVFINQQLGNMSTHKKIFVNPFHTKKVFANMKRAGKDFSGRITPLFDTMMVQPVEEMGEDSDHPTDSTPIPIIDQPSSSSQPKKKQPSKKAQRQEAEVPQDEAEHEESVPTPSNDPQPSGEDSMQLTDLMVLCTKLQTQVLDLQKAKDAQAKEIAALKKRIQRGVLEDDEMHVEAKVDGKDCYSYNYKEINLLRLLIQIKANNLSLKLFTTTAYNSKQLQRTRIRYRGVVCSDPIPLKRKGSIALDDKNCKRYSSCSDNSFISEGANRLGARATGAAPGIKSICNSTCRVGGRPGKSLGNTSGKS
ncbi:hypothetical protein Tco_0318100 [Tanacetum coccineum]